MGKFTILSVNLVLLFVGACAQSRKGSSAGQMSETQTLQCSNEDTGEFDCLRMRVNYDKNEAYIEAIGMDLTYTDPLSDTTSDLPIRIWARHNQSDQYELVAENIYNGDLVTFIPDNGHVSEYIDWLVETTGNYTSGRTDYVEVGDFEGMILFDQQIIWEQVPSRYQDKTQNPFDQ